MNFLLPQLIDSHAKLRPNADAVQFLDQTLSYIELVTQSNQLANALVAKGITKGDRVGIYMDKCLEMSVALYGIMKAGAVYVPLDPHAPETRLAEIIDDCDIQILISATNKQKRLDKIAEKLNHHITVIGFTSSNTSFTSHSWQWVFDQHSSTQPKVKMIESDLAYIIYTSGSTGRPKGIMHTHHSGLSYARWAANEYQLTASDRLGNHCPLHFDISIFDWFAGAVAGACTIVIPDDYTKFPATYSEYIAATKMTVLFTVPFALIQLSLRGVLAERDMSALRLIIFGGEPFPIKHLRSLAAQLPEVTLDNMYGPAEVNGCSHFTVGKLEESALAIPIGKISDIAESLIVDEHNRKVKVGETGELLVRTPTMMQGYWARPDLNQRAFYHHNDSEKLGTEYTQKFYRTGDLVKMDKDQNMWFLGRKDRQVKVRGYRIELDEVEAVLVSHEDVEEAAAYSVSLESEVFELHCAYTLKAGKNTQNKDLLKYLKQHLPSYAVPTTLLSKDSFPRTTSDKIDRTTLSKEASRAIG